MREKNIALGYYQNYLTAKKVIKELRKQGFKKIASIHHTRSGYTINRFFPLLALCLTWLSFFIFNLMLFGLQRQHPLFLSDTALSSSLIFTFTLAALYSFYRLKHVIDPLVIEKFKKILVVEEILVVIQVGQKEGRQVLAILRQVKSGHPVTFLLRAPIFEKSDELFTAKEPLTLEQLNHQTLTLAQTLKETTINKDRAQPLLERLKTAKNMLEFLREDVAEGEHIEQTLVLSAEWLLDNMYLIEGTIAEVQQNLPQKFYRELPKVIAGPFKGTPRIYVLATELVNATANKISCENLLNFLTTYQTVHSLTIGELWAFPLMLRLRLIEGIQSLAIHVDSRMREGELASFWGNRLLHVAHHQPEQLADFFTALVKDQPNPSSHFAEELLDHLFDEEAAIPLIRSWLEGQFSKPITEILHQEQMLEAAEQVAFSNSMLSLITLSQLSWREIFEKVSPVDAILKEDPVYSKMDFATRNRYRSTIELLARRSPFSEVAIATQVIHLAKSAPEGVERHSGYYLIDQGLPLFKKKLNFSSPFALSYKNWIKNQAALFYLGTIGLLTCALEIGLAYLFYQQHFSLSSSLFFLTICLFPLSEISVQLLNFALSRILPPAVLPKLSFEKEIPYEYKTLVVIPTILFSEESIKEEIYRLEIRYLANIEPALLFGIFSDFMDATTQETESDRQLLEVAIKEIANLENKYGTGIFFLFHRQRRWSTSERAWIGWERKRGKLEQLNCFLMGEKIAEEIVYAGNKNCLKNIRYVITLDSDTQLPKNTAKELIETIAHPLNQAVLDEKNRKLIRGYSLIQPRICTDFTHTKNSFFSKIFSEPSVIDPYTKAISNAYQDLTGEGTYHGKGIYDLHTFHHTLSNRFPENHLLSHDLLEGAYAHVGFASGICLFDLYPADYLSASNRQHRWIRGDFQIINWLYRQVPFASTKEPNQLNPINRWKIFDNLRRALTPVALLILLVSSWLTASQSASLTKLVTSVLLLPSLIFLLNYLLNFSFSTPLSFFEKFNQGMLRVLITIAVLPYEAWLAADAIFRVFYRKLFSKQLLLEWTASGYSTKNFKKVHAKFIWQLLSSSLFALSLLTLISLVHPQVIPFAFPYCLLWILAPLIIYSIDKPLRKRADQNLSHEDKELLRLIARKTWRFFDDFVNASTHHLPPDNYQTALKTELALRTSPTNIGMGLLAALSAKDLHYLSLDSLANKLSPTMHSLNQLERYEGHFFNWYAIDTLAPLYPRYISTVDSGNFLASLWTLEQGLHEQLQLPLLPSTLFNGIRDVYLILCQELTEDSIVLHQLPHLRKLLYSLASQPSISALITAIQDSLPIIQQLVALPLSQQETSYDWLKQIEIQVTEWNTVSARYFSWIFLLKSLSDKEISLISSQAINWREQLLQLNPSLYDCTTPSFFALFYPLIQAAQNLELPLALREWGKKLEEALAVTEWFAKEKLSQIQEIIAHVRKFSDEMNMQFLYNRDRKLFTIGYNVDERRSDSSYYDLLASEARIASLVSIAKENIPLDHWWALGRSYTVVKGRYVLLSWGGTMFEYLMPLIFNKQYPDSLLGNACENVVASQIAYCRRIGIPWGISEAAFSAIDAEKTYQYRSFGIPGIGLKRGLEKDLVVSPYSSALALAVNAKAAIENLKILADPLGPNLLGPYGYYESIDFSRQGGPDGTRGVGVYVYMAHHQGMILTSINNVLHDHILSTRFHSDPRISGVESILFERIPSSSPIKLQYNRQAIPQLRLQPFSLSPIMGEVDTPHSVTPKIALLSNGTYSTMITNAGGGYSRYGDYAITRWRSDTTQDNWGKFYYIKDLDSGRSWSATYQPTQVSATHYSASFKADRAEFKRKDHQIETFTEIVVSPEDPAEVWLMTLTNHSNQTRHLEITSYLELALAPQAADRAHPAFNKLFIETEARPELASLVAFRRLRSNKDQPLFATHTLATSVSLSAPLSYETDRAKFIGRNGLLKDPLSLHQPLSQTTGTVLDPIFSLRATIKIEPGQRVKLSFITAVTESRAASLALIEKYKDISISHRAIELAWNYAQLELRHLRIHQEEVQLFQKLASRILYPHTQLRPSSECIRKNNLGQSSLWIHGISGDLPIVIVTVGDMYDTDLVKQILIAHAFWRLRGLKVDLIILNEEQAGYNQPLFEQLQRIIQAQAHWNQINTAGGVFLLNLAQLSAEEKNLILAIAHAILIAARGSLRQQLVSPLSSTKYPAKLKIHKKLEDYPSACLPFLELPYFNGLGGFTPDGKKYVIYLDYLNTTPAPWINVIANSKFGTLVSEAGMGTTWYGNSQTNRLTPWSNDPIMNPITDAIYIRDNEMGTVWTPTAAPIREKDAYRISHGQGYTLFEHNSHGIEQELTVFVPSGEGNELPVRIQRLRLINRSPKNRHLTVTAYSEWVLGGEKEQTQMHIFTEWDAESQALFAFNHYHPDFGDHVAFSTSIPAASSFTGDRTEFLGRNSSPAQPAALKRESLSGNTGAKLDPCAALQIEIELLPDELREMTFILGYAKQATEARELIANLRIPNQIEHLLNETQLKWQTLLDTIQVTIPDLPSTFLINRWLLYQTLSCRIWGRTAFYQSSGAYGFRDQLQDVMALVYSCPAITREHILRAAARQFVEGDVQHWWHAESGAGIRTRISDDLLWLPFVTAHYVRITGDTSILAEQISFLQAPILTEEQHEVYGIPQVSHEKASLLEHCRRALHQGITAGPHGLPLMGGGDWNDGMNNVGIKGQGESIWLGWFLLHVMQDFADLLDFSAQSKEAEGYRMQAKLLAETIEKSAWDGAWYRRAYFDEGHPLGSNACLEARIDSLAQSWAAICLEANSIRVKIALQSAYDHLVDHTHRLVKLLTPSFNTSFPSPGYIQGYPPGVRENGGQYTHGSLWLAMAYARQADGNKAFELLQHMHPLTHSLDLKAAALYKVEPYIVVADVYDLKDKEGSGGWSWYTGASGWMYRIWLEEVLGFKLRVDRLKIECAIPKEWPGFSLRYRYHTAVYEISVTNPAGLKKGLQLIKLDGVKLIGDEISLKDDGACHTVEIILT